MYGGGFLLATFFVCFGLSLIIAPNFWWTLQANKNRKMGLKSKKPKSWDIEHQVTGYISIVFGIILFIFSRSFP